MLRGPLPSKHPSQLVIPLSRLHTQYMQLTVPPENRMPSPALPRAWTWSISVPDPTP